MTKARAVFVRVLPVILLLAIYWPAVTAWFFQDDFGWLNLHHDVHSLPDLARVLFAPKAHGNMRPLGENAYWLVLPAIFGADALPLHIAAFLTQCASLLLLGGIVRRLTKSGIAAFSAQILWMANIGLAPALGWSSIYNQLLSGFFFLLAFYFLLRHGESGKRSDWVFQWIAFVLGLGALEINVVYPALALLYALLFARPLVKRVLPMFAVSALAVFLHFYFAPPAASGVYAPTLDSRVFSTLWTYWAWSLGPMPLWLTLLLTAAVGLLIASSIRQRKYAAVLGLAWFFIPLLPYLPLPGHKMDYYLAVPAIGIAMLGAAAIAHGGPARVLAAACLLVYLGASLPKSLTVARWEHGSSCWKVSIPASSSPASPTFRSVRSRSHTSISRRRSSRASRRPAICYPSTSCRRPLPAEFSMPGRRRFTASTAKCCIARRATPSRMRTSRNS